MSCENGLKERRFSTKEEELRAHLENGELSGDKERIEAVRETRHAISEMGYSASSLGHISHTEARRGNGKMAVASYEPGTGQTNLGDLDTIRGIAESIGQTVRQTTKNILAHEKKHQQADEAEGAEQIDQMIAHLFGIQAVHDIEEATASLDTTQQFDAYQNERNAASGYAQKLGINLISLSEIKLKGDYEKLAEHAANSGLYGEVQRAA